VLSEGSWLESKRSEGGTALARVREQLAAARAALDEQVGG
jgi:argininosuccinate lyase